MRRKKRNYITFISPDDPEFHILKRRKNVVVVMPEHIRQIAPSVLKQIQQRKYIQEKKSHG